jgi:hypothetical protein
VARVQPDAAPRAARHHHDRGPVCDGACTRAPCRTSMKKVTNRNKLRFGTGRPKMAFEHDGRIPNVRAVRVALGTGYKRVGGKSAGVAKRPRELISHPKSCSHSPIRNFQSLRGGCAPHFHRVLLASLRSNSDPAPLRRKANYAGRGGTGVHHCGPRGGLRLRRAALHDPRPGAGHDGRPGARFCRFRLFTTCDLGHRGARGAVGLGLGCRFTV